MLNTIWMAVLAGTLLGFLSGLGTGGGSLLILYLTLALGMDPNTARQINLMFFLPAALVACLFRGRRGKLALPPLLPAIFWGCTTAAIFSILHSRMDTSLLRRLFGILLLATGLRELCYRPRKAR